MKKNERVRWLLVALAGVRILVSIAAIPLAPFLYEEHFVLLVLMRPTKEVLLAGGFLVRLGKVGLIPLLLAAVPLAIFGVWHSYYLGRFHSSQIRSGRMPWIVKKIIRPGAVKKMQKLLDRKGMRLVVLGRLAVFPSAVVGAAAGAGDVESREFIPADLIGGLLSIVEVVGLGFALGYAYKRAGPWITVASVAALAAVAFIVARWLRREGKRSKRSSPKKAGRKRRAARATSRS